VDAYIISNYSWHAALEDSAAVNWTRPRRDSGVNLHIYQAD